MGIAELLVIAVGLSMDAFAVSVGKGLCMGRVRWGQALAIALCFGLFQAAMPLVGWALGTQFSQYVEPVDHWVAFGLLGVIGAKRVWDGLHEQPDDACPADEQALPVAELLVLAVATSIDALSVGFTIAHYDLPRALTSAGVIAAVTFVICTAGLALGKRFGTRLAGRANLLGGGILIAIGLEIFFSGVLG